MERETRTFPIDYVNQLTTPQSIRIACGPDLIKFFMLSPDHGIELTSLSHNYGVITEYKNGWSRTTSINLVDTPQEGKYFCIHQTITIPKSQVVKTYFAIKESDFNTHPQDNRPAILDELHYLYEIQKAISTAHPQRK